MKVDIVTVMGERVGVVITLDYRETTALFNRKMLMRQLPDSVNVLRVKLSKKPRHNTYRTYNRKEKADVSEQK